MKQGSVYKITSPSGKVYIGSSKEISCRKRWNSYKGLYCKNQVKLYRSLVKYGPDNHLFEIVWTGVVEELFTKEVEYGVLYDVLSKEKGLNLRLPKAGELPTYTSNETKEKMRKSLTGLKRSEEQVRQMSIVRMGVPRSLAFRKKVSEVRMGMILTEEWKSNISKGVKNKISVGKYNISSGELITTYPSLTDAYKDTGISLTSLSKCVKGKQKYAGEFVWKKIGADLALI